MIFSDYIEKEIISKRFIITLIILYAWITTNQVPDNIMMIIIGFYFGSHREKLENVVKKVQKGELNL